MGAQGTVKPDTRKLPVTLDRARRDVENGGDLFHGKTAEVAQFNNARFSRVFPGEAGECFVNGKDFVDTAGVDASRSGEVVVHLDAMQTAGATFCGVSAGVIDKDLAHDTSGETDELAATGPVNILLDKTHVRLVNEGGGLKRVIRALAAHVCSGQPMKLGVD